MTFGEVLRVLRQKRGLSIKELAPEVDVDYSYISKLENEKVLPSAGTVRRIARFFDYEEDELMVLADKIPADIADIIREHPREVFRYLRERFADGRPRADS